MITMVWMEDSLTSHRRRCKQDRRARMELPVTATADELMVVEKTEAERQVIVADKQAVGDVIDFKQAELTRLVKSP